MAVVELPIEVSNRTGFRYIALTADTLPTSAEVRAGDKAVITDGTNKVYDGSAWQTDTGEALGSVTVTSISAGNNNIGDVDIASLPNGGFEVQTTITRPANTTPYSAGDILGGAIDLGVLGPSAGIIEIVSSRLEADISAIPSGMTSFLLYLYSVTPPSAVADNGVFDLPAGDRASYLGALSLGTPADLGSTLYCETNDHKKQIKLAGTHLFGYLVTVGGFTPAANSEVYKITLSTKAVVV